MLRCARCIAGLGATCVPLHRFLSHAWRRCTDSNRGALDSPPLPERAICSASTPRSLRAYVRLRATGGPVDPAILPPAPPRRLTRQVPRTNDRRAERGSAGRPAAVRPWPRCCDGASRGRSRRRSGGPAPSRGANIRGKLDAACPGDDGADLARPTRGCRQCCRGCRARADQDRSVRAIEPGTTGPLAHGR